MAILDIPLTNVQPTLVSGTNIKTINGTSILGSGNLVIASGISIGDTIGGGTAGSVLFLGADGVLAQDNANFFWDDANNRLGIETNTPSAKIHAKAASATDIAIIAQGTTAQTGNLFEGRNVGGTVTTSIDVNGTITFNDFVVGSGGINGAGSFYINNASKGGRIYSTDNSSRAGFFFADMGVTGAFFAQWGGQTSAFPAIKRNGQGIDIRLADDSGYADLAIGNLVSNTGSGIQLATAATQKIGFWGATPITQPTTAITAATYASVSGSFVKASDTFDGYSIGQVVKALRNEGLLA